MLIKTICFVGLTKDEILAQCLFFFLAGFETTGTTLGFALYYLAMNPEVQEKAQAEVDQVLGNKVRLNKDFCLDLRSQHALRIDKQSLLVWSHYIEDWYLPSAGLYRQHILFRSRLLGPYNGMKHVLFYLTDAHTVE